MAAERVLSTLAAAARGCDCIALSGGVDTSVVALAARLVGQRLRGFTSYYTHGTPRDLPYARHVAGVLGIELHEAQVDNGYISSRAGLVARCTGRRDHVELRNDVVFLRTLEEARAAGCRCILLGDGGDEVFAGYSFMLLLGSRELREAIIRMATRGRYPGLELAGCIGLEARAPLLSDEAVEAALSVPVECLRGPLNTGKWLLRLILAGHGLRLVAERPKTPAEAGAGTEKLGRRRLEQLVGMELPDCPCP